MVIGDVHGCAFELSALVDRAAITSSDRVIFVGDLVARGPASRDVLRIYRSLEARGTVGNHDARLLEARGARRAGLPLPRLGPSHEHLLGELDDQDWATLGALEPWIDVRAHDLRVVHAGLVPGLPMERQDRWALVHMRSFDEVGRPTDRPGACSWAASYSGPPHVAFGHDARRGLQLHEHATGLDTGCVYGGHLSALVLDDGAQVPAPKERPDCIVSVPARQRYHSVSM
jgi:hypothetical protein